MCTVHSLSRRDLLRTSVGSAVLGSVAGLGVVERVAARYALPQSRPGKTFLAAQAGEPLHFHQSVVTPSGTPLGGWVDVDVWSDGRYRVKFHMHSSSVFGDFDFDLRAYLSAPGFPTMVFLHSGHVSGVDDADHEEDGSNPLIPVYWTQLQAGANYQVHKDYSWGGIVGGLTQLVSDLFDLGAGIVGAALGAIIGATREAIGWLGATLGPGGTLGVVGGVIVFAVGAVAGLPIGAALIVGTIAGVATGAIVESMVESRPLNDAEITLARQVFGDSLPYGDVILTNMAGMSGRAFCAPGVDGKTYINLGSNYADPIGSMTSSYTVRGQLLIHELTHAWQIADRNFVPGFMCSALVTQANLFGDSVYAYDGFGSAWGDLNIEQQASIVDDWFAATGKSNGYRPMDQGSPYYRYIWDDVLGRNAPTTAPGNLRRSSGLAVSQWPGHLDVFYPTPDGSVGGVWWDQTATWSSPYTIAGPSSTTNAAIASVSRVSGHLDLFWAMPDGSVGGNWWNQAATWASPYAIAGPGSAVIPSAPASAPIGSADHIRAKLGGESGAPVIPRGQAVAVMCRVPVHMDVFWVTPDGSVGANWWNEASGWSTPYAIAGPGSAAGAIASVARWPTHMDVFWVMPDGSVGGNWWNEASGWATPYAIAGPGSAQPTSLAVVNRVPDHMDVFWVNPDGSVGANWWNVASGWATPYTIAGPGSATGAVAAVARVPQRLDVFWVSPDGSVGHTWFDEASGWAAPFTIAAPGSAIPASPISVVNQSPLHLDVFWTTPDGAMATTWWDASAAWAVPFPITPPGIVAV